MYREVNMKYTKKPLSYSQQAQLLLDRGLIADKSTLEKTLKKINYYRLSGYYYHFIDKKDKFVPHTTLTKILSAYNFDKRLRIILFKYIEIVEVGLRSYITYIISHKYGPFALENRNNFRNLKKEEYNILIDKINNQVHKSREIFIDHFMKKYGDCHTRPAIWMLIEIMSFGSIIKIYKGLNFKLKKKISKHYNLSSGVIKSWMLSIGVLRNCIAHHNRIWKRSVSVKPKKVNKGFHLDFYIPYKVDNNSLFGVICTIQYFCKYFCEGNELFEELKKLQYTFGLKLLQDCGFPENWKESEIWRMK